MVRFCHAPLPRFCLAVLIALALMLNGMGRVVAAARDDGVGNTVVIAGTVVTLCQFGNDADGKNGIHPGHACDQCALRLMPLLPQTGATPSVIRFPNVLRPRPASSETAGAAPAWSAAWPRGPPAA